MLARIGRHDERLAAAFRSNDEAVTGRAKIDHARDNSRPRIQDNASIEYSVKNFPQAGILGLGSGNQVHRL